MEWPPLSSPTYLVIECKSGKIKCPDRVNELDKLCAIHGIETGQDGSRVDAVLNDLSNDLLSIRIHWQRVKENSLC